MPVSLSFSSFSPPHSLSHSYATFLCLVDYREYAADVNMFVARKAIQAIGKIALRLPGRANTCTQKLISLISMEIGHVTSQALICLASKLMLIVTVQ